MSSLKMQRKCRKEKDKDFCTDETKKEMLGEQYFRAQTNIKTKAN